MTSFVQFDPATGEIVRVGECPTGDADIQGPNVVLGVGAPGTHYVGAGALVAYTAAQVGAKAVRPALFWLWSNSTFKWTDPRTLAQHQANKWASIKASRDAAVAAPKTTSIGQFDADEASQNNLNKVIALVQLAQAKGLAATANYTLATNARVSLTLAQLQTSALEMGAQVQALYDKADALRTQINAAPDIPTMEAITWAP